MIEALKEYTITTHSQALNKRYNVVLTPTRYSKKPSNWGSLHNELNSAKTINLTLYELLEEVAQGRTWRNGIYDYPELKENEKKLIKKWQQENNATDEKIREQVNQYHALKEHKRNVLVSTNLAVLDVDDIIGTVDPVEVMEDTGAVALYYTFSHNRLSGINTKENRYRLLFDLDKTVYGKEQLEYVQENIRMNLLKEFPYLNDQVIGKKSHGVENLTTQFHGTNKGYEVNTNFKTVEVADLIEQHEREQAFNQSLIQLEKMTSTQRTTTADEILEVANYLGDLNDILSFEEWRTLAIGLWNTAQMQAVDDSVIIEALEILNGHDKSKDAKYYLAFKLPLVETTSRATIGTMYKIAIDKGYKLKPKEQPPIQKKSELDNVKKPIIIEQFIGKDNFLSLLTNTERRILLLSETGTGKTRSAIEASRELNKQNEKSFVYIALPSIALAEQTASKYSTNTAIIGTNRVNTRSEVKKAQSNDTRLLIGTYNKTDEVCSHLKDYEITVIADEAHKEISDYNFRYEAINTLFSITDRDNVVKFVAMTGTASEIDYSDYDSVAPFELKEPKVLADKLQFVEYMKATSYETITARAIEQEVKQGKKVLAFVDNKKIIRKLARALRSNDIKVSEIKADNRKSKTYRNILDNEKFDDATDVILSTRVLADGINIQNTKDYVLIIAPNHHQRKAMFHNIDLIRQASNRFRNQYEKIMVLLYVNEHAYRKEPQPLESDRLYNLEHQYKTLLRTAKIIKAQTESQFKGNITYFTPSIAENLAGLFRPREAKNFNFKRAYKNKRLAEQNLNHDTILLKELEQLEQDIFTIDTRHIRNQASQDKERYYSLNPYAFKKALIESLEVLEVEMMSAHKYFISKQSYLEKVLKDINALDVKNNKDKREHLKIVLHELIYAKLKQEFYMKGRVDESIDEWQLLKDKMNSFQYTALTNVIGFLEYDEVIRELEYVEKQAQTNELVKGFNAMTEYANFILQGTGKMQETERIFNILQDNLTNKEFESVAERDDLIDDLAKQYRIKRYNIAKKKKLFTGVFNKFFVQAQSKTKRVDGKVKRVRSYKLIDFKYLAEQRDITTHEIEAMYRRYMYK